MIRRGHGSSAAAMSLTTTPSVVAVGGNVQIDTRATPIPDECFLSILHGEITDIAGGATTVNWWLSADLAGDVPLTDEVTETIKVGQTTATDGSAVTPCDIDYSRASNGTAGTIYVWAQTNVGTCSMTPRLTYRQEL